MSRAEMEEAFARRDGSYDGLFYAAVKTTGVFCRPSCPARKPNPENVVYYGSIKEALLSGFRPCKRCRPLSSGDDEPSWLEPLLSRIQSSPNERITDQDLRGEGIDPAVVRRYFRRAYGVTFLAYCRSLRLGGALTALKEGAAIDDAVFDFGWESHSGFREAFSKAAGFPPGSARDSDHIRLTWVETPIGLMVAGATDRAICLFEFSDPSRIRAQLGALSERFGLPLLPGESPLFDELRGQLADYFAGSRRSFELPLDYRGTDFQLKVWQALLRIPYGETRSYSDVAREIGAPLASRAVGHANGQNRIAIVIPCHRVIASGGGLGGYGGGIWRKLRLLESEGAR